MSKAAILAPIAPLHGIGGCLIKVGRISCSRGGTGKNRFRIVDVFYVHTGLVRNMDGHGRLVIIDIIDHYFDIVAGLQVL